MNFKTTSLLFGILIGMLWLFGLVLQVRKGTFDEGLVFPSIHGATTLDIETVVLNRKGKEYRLVHTDKGWELQQPPQTVAVRADEGKVDRIIDQVRKARKVEEADVSRNLARYGLDHPAEKVTLKTRGIGKEYTLYLGEKSPDDLYIYVNSSERPREVMAVKASSLDSLFPQNINDLRPRSLLEVTESNTSYLRLSEPAGKKTDMVLEKTSEGLWRFKQPPYGVADFDGAPPPSQDPGVKGVLNAIGSLRVDDLNDFESIGGRSLEDYGLAKGKETLRIEVESSGPRLAGKDKTGKEALLIGGKINEQYYARLETEQAVARVSAKRLEPVFRVLGSPGILRSRDLTQVEPGTVDAVDVRTGPGLKNELKMRSVDATLWKLYTPEGASYRGNETAITGDKGLLNALRGKSQIKEFFDAGSEEDGKKLDAKLGLDSPVAEVSLYVGGVEKKKDGEKDKKEEAKDKKAEVPAEVQLKKGAKPAVTLAFGKSEKDLVYVKRVSDVGGVSRVAVPTSVLEKLTPPEGALAFFDDELPSFNVLDAVKLELVRGTEKFVVDKGAPKDKEKKEPEKAKDKDKEAQAEKEPPKEKDVGLLSWRMSEPQEIPGRTTVDDSQVEEVLETLARLKVVKWVQRVGPKEDLAKYGLQPPALTATVTVRKKDGDKTEEYVYKFGKDNAAEKDKGIYALQNKTDLVFLAQPGAVKTLRDAELRDRVVFKFDPAKVKKVELVGWKKAANFVVTLLLEKTEKGWTASGLKGFEVNSDKAQRFVGDLSHLKAQQFVVFKGGPRPEHKLSAEDAALAIDVKTDDLKTGYTLTIGELNADKTGFYAQASTLPGVVLLLPKETFEPLLRHYSYFSKDGQAAP